MLGGIQLLRSYLGGGGVDQNAKACELFCQCEGLHIILLI